MSNTALKAKLQVKWQVGKNQSKNVVYFKTAENTKIFIGSNHWIHTMISLDILSGKFYYYGPKNKLP